MVHLCQWQAHVNVTGPFHKIFRNQNQLLLNYLQEWWKLIDMKTLGSQESNSLISPKNHWSLINSLEIILVLPKSNVDARKEIANFPSPKDKFLSPKTPKNNIFVRLSVCLNYSKFGKTNYLLHTEISLEFGFI